MRPTRRHPAAKTARRAFTLVEMLVVMGIIVTLVLLMMPVVNTARNMAKGTATQALIHSLETGLNMFKSESRLGRQYPPSYYSDLDPYGVFVTLRGAQTLVWALAGPDLLGTAGFDPPGEMTMEALYAVDTDGKPAKTRYGPFIDISKATIEKPSLGPLESDAPVFMDDFGSVVLYFKADIAAGPMQIYNIQNNSIFFDSNQHPLLRNEPGEWWDYDQNEDTFSNGSGFLGYIQDQRVAEMSGGTRYGPHKPDSFLLISPGRDKLYGTADDIANFPFNEVE